jgi:hypothetical protein
MNASEDDKLPDSEVVAQVVLHLRNMVLSLIHTRTFV